ncbi:unnamed protein product [Parascedosporium putredinis]|uniref:Dihydroxyacetone kinase n=1 Tax=Parascedosporium putredinis TaxID=1442378 RepID=A0A9P1HAU8_9PEZI|nr:unnamed protein product [Parascedosporium putredinis]CAI8004332.1 unnamed protein product [Parascedosporium putredinis]
MSTRHLFKSSDGLVVKSLRGLVAYNSALCLDETNRVIFDTAHDSSQVSLISGGGSGHEPAWSGYVGSNMLAASVSGDIFASPRTKQVLSAIERVPSGKGVIIVVGNYTGDCLHFGLAREMALSNGVECRLIICGDDVSVGTNKGGLVGRRGLAGQIGVLKLMGGASGTGGSLDDVYDLGLALAKQTVSIAATLDHCHVPGRQGEHTTVPDNGIEIGTGPHNEPGYKKLDTMPAAEEVIRQLLAYCLDASDPARSYVRFEPGDETLLLISNFGGMSYLEMGALTDEVLCQLEASYNMVPSRIYSGPIETSLNAPAFSLSLINMTAAAKTCAYSVHQMKEFADVKTDTHWESMAGNQRAHRRSRNQQFINSKQEITQRLPTPLDSLTVDPDLLEKMLRCVCDAVISAEPDLTRWDTAMGDGDCGETVKTGATFLLNALNNNLASSGSIGQVLRTIGDLVESQMGGTLGGILGILFVSLQAAMTNNFTNTKDLASLPLLWGTALAEAVENLGRYTLAKVGDRTVMDTLIPFSQALRGGDFDAAVEAAIQGAEATKRMAPKLGRATYIGGLSNETELPPDPGAWAAMEAIKGLQRGMNVS